MVVALNEAIEGEKRLDRLGAGEVGARAECLSQLRSAESRAIQALVRMGTVTDRSERGVGPPIVPLPSESAALRAAAAAEVAVTGASAAASSLPPPPLSSVQIDGSTAAPPSSVPAPLRAAVPVGPSANAREGANEEELVARAINFSLQHLRNGLKMGIRRSISKLENVGPKPPVTAESVAKIIKLFPPPVDEPLTVAELMAARRHVMSVAHDVVFSVASVGSGINNKRSDSAPGMSGLSARVVKQCWHRGTERQRNHLISLLSILGNGLLV